MDIFVFEEFCEGEHVFGEAEAAVGCSEHNRAVFTDAFVKCAYIGDVLRVHVEFLTYLFDFIPVGDLGGEPTVG